MIPPIARRFVAGESADGALERATARNDEGLAVILNQLGEHYDDPAAAAADRDDYRQLLRDMAAVDLDGCISVKPTQLGLNLGTGVFREHLASILEVADDLDRFVWLDMEDHQTTDATLDAYEAYATSYDGMLGVCLQANLRRTPDDLARLADLPGKLRLVKGAYDEPVEIAYPDKAAVDRAYRDLLRQAFEQCEDGIAVASHDDAMLDLAASLHDQQGTPYEVQMLMGVREDYQRELAADREVYQYIPYGDKWLSYFYRRLLERKENLLFGLRAVLRG
ncbi:MAG: proline dehydrogenase family protein [Halobacteriota archaeon]